MGGPMHHLANIVEQENINGVDAKPLLAARESLPYALRRIIELWNERCR